MIEKINPVSFRYNGKAGFTVQDTYVGVIAQQMQRIAPYAVKTVKMKLDTRDAEPTDILEFDPNALWYITINAIKEQQKMMEEQQKQINELNKLVSAGSPKSETLLPESQRDVILQTEIILDQNNPNPFKETTTITYSIPEYISFAQIIFTDNTGRIISTVDINQTGEGQLNVKAEKLSSGIYSYSIVVDGKTIVTKKMMKTK